MAIWRQERLDPACLSAGCDERAVEQRTSTEERRKQTARSSIGSSKGWRLGDEQIQRLPIAKVFGGWAQRVLVIGLFN
jgi:hypothetical protein